MLRPRPTPMAVGTSLYKVQYFCTPRTVGEPYDDGVARVVPEHSAGTSVLYNYVREHPVF
jgi:hypothetical protein